MALDPQVAAERFYELVWPLRAEVLRLAKLLCGRNNDADADDLAQETLLKAFAGIESFKRGTNVRAWLMQILRNARIDRVRSSAREQASVSLDAAELDPAEPENGSSEMDFEQVWQDPQQVLSAFSDQQVIDALQDLPEEIRLTLLLVDVQQMDQTDAAKVLDVPVGTIKSRTHRGRKMLRDVLHPVAMEMRLVQRS
jgi:RNA polymerase sigma-70 factor (ECF subfamily)